MKSILFQQAPHRSPWLEMRVRQPMQTGGNRRLATELKMVRKGLAPAPTLARATAGASDTSSASLIDMKTMIGLGGPELEERRHGVS